MLDLGVWTNWHIFFSFSLLPSYYCYSLPFHWCLLNACLPCHQLLAKVSFEGLHLPCVVTVLILPVHLSDLHSTLLAHPPLSPVSFPH